MTDLVTFGATALRLSAPQEDRIETAREFVAHADGPESNAAVAARRLGTDAAWVSRLPDTPLGRRVVGELQSHDVAVQVAWADAGRQGLAFHERGAAPRGNTGVEDRTGAAIEQFDAADLPTDLVEDADGVYVTGATPARSTTVARATAKFLGTAAEAGALTAFGLRYEPVLWDSAEAAGETLEKFLPAVDVFVAEETDVAAVLGRDGQPAEVAHALASTYGFETVALTREMGAVVWNDATVHDYPAVGVETVDAAGARDAFAGAFVSGLLGGAAPSNALRRGMAADALARTVAGPIPTVTRAEVERVAAEIVKSRE